MACVYKHINKITKEIFYIGISNNKNRPYSKHNRNNYWHNIVNKYGFDIEILFDNITYKEAIEIEIYLIHFYGRKIFKTGTLVNITSGGEGTPGRFISDTFKENCKNRMLGKKWSENRRISSMKYRMKGVSESTRNKMSINNAKTKSKKTIDLSTGIIYNSCLDACNALNLKYKATKAQLNGQNKNKSTLKYI